MDKTRWFLIAAIAVLVVICGILVVIALTGNSESSSDSMLGTAPPNSVNVKDYGAVGDGVTDDGPAIVKVSVGAAGRIIYFPTGTYYVVDVNALPVGWPSGWKGDGGAGQASYIKSVITAGAGQTAWDFRWITP